MKSLEILKELREMNKTKDKKSYYDVIESDLKVLELIKKKPDLVWWCYETPSFEYLERITPIKFWDDENKKQLEKEFNIVKEWLENDA